jgi:hypothetical protein
MNKLKQTIIGEGVMWWEDVVRVVGVHGLAQDA